MSALPESLPAAGFSAAEIRDAVQRARAARRRACDLLAESAGLAPEELLRRLAATFGYRPIALQEMLEGEPLFERIPFAEAMRRSLVALRDPGGALQVVVDDPFDSALAAWVAEWAREPFEWRVALREDLAAWFVRQEQGLRALDRVEAEPAAAQGGAADIEDLSLRAAEEADSEVVRLVRSTLHDALKLGASDVHFETTPAGLTVRFRIDGMLSQATTVQNPEQAAQAISRIKVLAELDITETRIPQDGRMRARGLGRNIDFRVSIMPSVHGEDAVLRVLDKQALHEHVRSLTLESLGFEGEDIRAIRRLAAEPHGMLLVTGPTGSGKTTTLYAAISEINHGSEKIVTIEDPVEYQLQGVLQIPVNEKKGLTFARGLRSILRHDPDKIMVGEIRDPETANIAVQSALTGHLVFTTVHANNVFDVLGRFLHMQVDTYSLASALNGILAQRLLRLICPACKQRVQPAPALLAESGLAGRDLSAYAFSRGAGCRECRGTGYRGRRAIAELLVLDDALRELLSTRAPVRQLKTYAQAHGTRLLRERALECVARGETTLEEINRVTFVA
jgi:general secretion pathway protein E